MKEEKKTKVKKNKVLERKGKLKKEKASGKNECIGY